MGLILEVKNMTMDFGGLRALDHLDLNVAEGEIVALIGPNGAGKTTFFNCITGIYAPTQGDVLLMPPGKKQARINGLKPQRIKTQSCYRKRAGANISKYPFVCQYDRA